MMRIFLMLLACGFVSAQGKKQVDAADAKMKAGDYKAAISLYSDAIKAEPKNAKYYNLRAFAYSLDKDYDKAYDDYSTSVKLAPDSAYMFYDRALFFFTVNALTEAQLDHDVALQKANGDKVLEIRLLALNADIRRNKGDLEGAVSDYKKVLEGNAEEGLKLACIMNLGAVLGKLNRNDEAISYLEQAVKLYPKVPSVYNNLGFRYLAKNDYEKALQLYDKAIALSAEANSNSVKKTEIEDNVSSALLYNNRGYAKLKLGDLKGALADVNQSIVFSPDNSYAYRNRALINEQQHNATEACNDISKALELGFTKLYGDEMENMKKAICK